MDDGPDKPKASAALRLLQGVALELRALAEETARFGETLSRDATIAGPGDSIGLLQQFDLFSQSLHGHALLIDSLSERIDGDTEDVAALHDLIGHIPFFSMRERLRAQLSGATRQLPEVWEEPSEENWF
jgi:hypothetical protein